MEALHDGISDNQQQARCNDEAALQQRCSGSGMWDTTIVDWTNE